MRTRIEQDRRLLGLRLCYALVWRAMTVLTQESAWTSIVSNPTRGQQAVLSVVVREKGMQWRLHHRETGVGHPDPDGTIEGGSLL